MRDLADSHTAKLEAGHKLYGGISLPLTLQVLNISLAVIPRSPGVRLPKISKRGQAVAKAVEDHERVRKVIQACPLSRASDATIPRPG